MTGKPIQNNVSIERMSSEMARNIVKPDVARISSKAQNVSATPPSVSNPTVSPLSSRYTYALGDDGRRYVLQLRITLPGGGFNAFA